MQKHTPGPWVAGFGDTKELGSVYGVGLSTKPDWTVVCVVSKADDITAQDIANARLIAAAPELLEELQELADMAYRCDSWQSFPSEPIDKARAVIAKAKGEQL